MRVKDSGDVLAYVGVAVGLSASVAANVVHAAKKPEATPFALVLAAFWPLCLFLALEVLARKEWSGKWTVWAARAAVIVVAAVAAVVSYLHLHHLLVEYNEDAASALIGPLAIDGLMAVCALALLNRAQDAPEAGEVARDADLSPVQSPEPAVPAVPAVPVVPKRNVNGTDLRVIEVAEIIRAAQARGEEASVNATATRYGVSWGTADRLHKRALAELEAKP